jgi:ABC-type branched-subunit amino acid transport system ATPase component
MLSIARALNGDPRLFLLDEPSDGVQPSIVQEIGEFLQILVRRRPIGVLIVEQNVELIHRWPGAPMSWTRVESSARWIRRRSQTLTR